MSRSPRPPVRAAVAVGLAVLCLAATSNPATAQSAPALSLVEALDIAQGSNPGFRAQQNDLQAVKWDVRSARAQLWLPSASIGGGISWQGAGEQRFGSLTAGELGFSDQPSFLFSNYNLGLSWALNGQRLLAPGEAKSRRSATEYRIQEAGSQLVLRVTQAYLEALRQAEGVVLADAQLDRAAYSLRLTQAQEEVGVGLALDTRRAEVQVGRAEVAVLQARNARDIATIRLYQEMGIEVDIGAVLSTGFVLEEPSWDAAVLTEYALAANPSIRELYANRQTAGVQVRMARSQYFPTLSVSAGWTAFTREASSTLGDESRLVGSAENARLNCLANNDIRSRLNPPLPPLNCSGFGVTEQDLAAVRQANDRFPFDFTQSPPSVSLSISLPLFQGLSRQRQVEAAEVARDDVREQLRAKEIGLRADIQATTGNVRTAYESALIEERNRDLADEQLRLAQERFAVGELPFAELVDAETGKAQADRDLLAAIYAYHDAVALLESIVGTRLR